jgi:hypothetical protein
LLAREEGALVSAAHGDDIVRCHHSLVSENLGSRRAEVNTFFCHHSDSGRVDLVTRLGTCRKNLNAVTSEVLEIASSHLRATCVVNTDEQNGCFLI